MNRMLDALRSRPRRQLLVNLLEPNPRDESKLVEELDFHTGEDEFLARLHHSELPKPDNMGYISWDRKSGEIVKGPAFDEIRPLLALMAAHDDELPDDWI